MEAGAVQGAIEKPLLGRDLSFQRPTTSLRSISVNKCSAEDVVGPQRRKLYHWPLNLKQQNISIRFFSLSQKFPFSCHGPDLCFSPPRRPPLHSLQSFSSDSSYSYPTKEAKRPIICKRQGIQTKHIIVHSTQIFCIYYNYNQNKAIKLVLSKVKFPDIYKTDICVILTGGTFGIQSNKP